MDWLHEKYRVQTDNDDVVGEITGYIVEWFSLLFFFPFVRSFNFTLHWIRSLSCESFGVGKIKIFLFSGIRSRILKFHLIWFMQVGNFVCRQEMELENVSLA